jgi:hypothetical protein
MICYSCRREVWFRLGAISLLDASFLPMEKALPLRVDGKDK